MVHICELRHFVYSSHIGILCTWGNGCFPELQHASDSCGTHCYRRGDIGEMLEEKNTLISGASAKLLKAIMVIMNGSSVFRSS